MFENQSINIIEDAEGDLRVSSLIIAGRTENQHASVMRIVREHQRELEAFGLVGFEIAPRLAGQHGGGDTTYAFLNEPQSTLLMTFMRNSPVVVEFKVELVKQFYAMRQALAAPKSLEARSLELLGELTAEVQRQQSAIAELAPKADAWEGLASGNGTYAVADAAKMLNQVGIVTGRDRLFQFMHGLGWVYRQSGRWQAKQTAVDAGRLYHKPQSHLHPETGETVLDAPQVRVTMKGVEQLRIAMLEPVAELEAPVSLADMVRASELIKSGV